MVEDESPYGKAPTFVIFDFIQSEEGISIDPFLKKRAQDYIIFSWVNCAKNMLPSAGIKEILIACLRYYGMPQSYENIESAKRAYYRLFQQWQQFNKNKTK